MAVTDHFRYSKKSEIAIYSSMPSADVMDCKLKSI